LAVLAKDKLLVEYKELMKLELTILEFTKLKQDIVFTDKLDKPKDN
jgi:hypothetical protein